MIPDFAADLKNELNGCNFKKNADFFAELPFFKPFKYYDKFNELLGVLENLRCDKTCRGGGGSPVCEVRGCCQDNDIEGCWECEKFETKKNSNF